MDPTDQPGLLLQDRLSKKSGADLNQELEALICRLEEANSQAGLPYEYLLPEGHDHESLEQARDLRAEALSYNARLAICDQELTLKAERARVDQDMDERYAPIASGAQALADAMPQLVWITYPNGHAKYFNRRWWEYTGLTYDEAKGHGWSVLLHPDDWEPCLERWKFSLESGEPYEIEYRIRRASDRQYRWFLGRGLPRRNKAGEIIEWIGTCTEVHDQKVAQEEVQKAKLASEHLNQAKDQFLATLSHELRTPLNTILGWARLMQIDSFSPEEYNEALQVIVKSAKIQAQLIEDILDVSRIINGKMQIQPTAFNLSSLAKTVLEANRLFAEEKGVIVRSEIEAELKVYGDQNRLQQVIWNLLNNAIKFTPSEGQVTVKLHQDDRHIHLLVKDNGKGIPSDLLPNIFSKFYQVDNSSSRQEGGLGLGLAIVKSLVELHGGHVEATSEGRDRGSTFHVKIPVRAESKIDTVSESRREEFCTQKLAKHTSMLSGKFCLLVDDEESARNMISAILKKHGADVIAVSSVKEAFEAFTHDTFDILISDIAMPGATGYDLIKDIRNLPKSKGNDIPAIALTAYASVQDRQEALAAGFNNHVAKPIEPNDLILCIIKELELV